MRSTSEVRPPQPVYTAIDPRIRQRRIAVRRDEGRRRLRFLMAGLLILTLSVGGWVAVRSPLLDVDRIEVEGIGHTPAEAVVGQASLRGGQAMVDVDEEGAARRVETLPWVAAATVERRWPATVRITVTERRAAAVTRADGPAPARWLLLDATARVLAAQPEQPPGLVVIERLGPAAAPGAVLAGTALAGSVLANVAGPLAVVAALSPALLARTAAVTAAAGGQVGLKLNPRGAVLLGPPAQLAAKLTAAETVLAQVDTGNLSTLDVRLPSSPVLTRG